MHERMRTAGCFILIVVLISAHANDNRISDKRLCGDPACLHPVSLAKTLIQYSSDDDRLLSFGKNVVAIIYSKSAGSKPDLWGAEIKGKRGYVPKSFVREYKIIKSSLKHIVDTEGKGGEVENTGISELPEDQKNTTPSISGSIEISKNVISGAEVTKLKSDEGSGSEEMSRKTPALEEVSFRLSTSADKDFSSFPGSGVSAEPLESETAPKLESVTQPYEVVDGTTVFFDTDGSQSETKNPIHETVTTPSGEPNAKHDYSSTPSPDVDVTTESQSSNEVSNNNKIKDNVITPEAEESSGHIYQYFSSWMSEGSGNVEKEEEGDSEEEEKELEEEKEEEEDEEEEMEVEEEEEGEEKRKTSGENEYNFDSQEKNILTSEQEKGEIKSEQESESKDTSNKGETHLSQEVNKENDYEGYKNESETTPDFVQSSLKEEINNKETKDKENLEELEKDSVKNHLNSEEEGKSEEQGSEDNENEGIFRNPPNEERTKPVNTVDTEGMPGESLQVDDANDGTTVSNIDEKELSKKISLDENVLPVQYEVEKQNVEAQETPEILHDEQSETPLISSGNNNITTEINDVKEQEEIDNSAGPIYTDDLNADSKTESLFFTSENNNDSVEKRSVSDINSEFLNLEKLKGVSDPLSVNENKSKYDISIKDSQPNVENISETVSSSSETEETVSFTEEITEPSAIEEFAVPIYEPSLEVPTVSSTDVQPDESIVGKDKDSILNEQISVESAGGYFPVVTNFFANLFGDSPTHVDVPEDDNESGVEDATEDIFKTDDSDKINRKTSYWETPHENSASEMTASATYKETCDSSAGIDTVCNDLVGKEPNDIFKTKGMDTPVVKESEDDVLPIDLQKSFGTFVCLVITGATVIIFSLGYFYIEKNKRDASLVAKINELEKTLLVSSKECIILKDELEATKDKLSSLENSSLVSNEIAISLNAEIEKYKTENAELEEQVASLEKELEVATEAGFELNRMLSDFLSSQNSSDSMMKSVEHLQKQLDSQQNTITSLTKSLNAKISENETLQSEINTALEKIDFLENDIQKVNEQLTSVISEILKVEGEISERNKLLEMQSLYCEDNSLLQIANAQKDVEVSELQKVIVQLQEKANEQIDNIVAKETEIISLKECLKQLKSFDDGGDDKLHALLDVGHIKAELKLLTIERDTLAEKLQGEEDARKLLEDHMKIVNEELNRLRENYEEADKEKTEAQTKLEVLSKYFKEKETQLQKELGLQEAKWLQKEGDATSTYEQIKCLQDEIENYRSQNDTLKKEVLEQERSLKSQIASLEKKAHENWVAARQAERKLEETKQEASLLRNRLTVVEKNITNNSMNYEPSKINDRLTRDSNGELPTSPVHLGISLEDSSSPQLFQHHDGLPTTNLVPTILPGPMIPPHPFVGLPPPGAFLPPPPPPPPPSSQSQGAPYMPPPLPLFPDRRPPPLGRMSSPPPHHFSPPPPDPRGTFSPYDDCSPPPSPIPIRYRSPPPHGEEAPDRFRSHRSPPLPSHFKRYSPNASHQLPHWDDSHGPTHSGFRPLPPSEHRNSPREPKGPALSSGQSSDSLEKSSRRSGRV